MKETINAYALPGLKSKVRLPNHKGFKEEYIIKAVADHFKIELQELIGHHRNRQFVFARHIAKYLLHQYTSNTLKGIGMNFKSSNRQKKPYQDHTTVMHSLTVVRNWYDTQDPMTEHIREIINNHL